jgi:uncharacterized protein
MGADDLQDCDEDELGPSPHPRAVMDLLQAIFLNRHEEIGPALAAGADINAPTWQGKSLLWEAAYRGNLSLVRLLLSHGADPNAPGDGKGQTPLIIATRMAHAEVIAALVAAGSDPARPDAAGLSAWDYARRPLCQDGAEMLRRAWREVRGTEPPS